MAVLGMRGLGHFSDEERPTNFREAILREYPQGGAVFTMVLGMLPTESVDDVKFTIFEQGLPQQEFKIESASGGTGYDDHTTFVLDDTSPVVNDFPARSWKVGMLGRIETTNEIFYVSGISAPDDLTVIRGIGNSGTGVTFSAGDACTIIGPCDKEGADTPSEISYDPSTRYNYIQTFRTSLTLTDDAAQTYYRTGNVLKNKKFDAAQDHAMQMEKAFLWGKRDEVDHDSDGYKYRTTGGLAHWLWASYKTDFTSSGLTKDGLNTFLQPIYTVNNGSQNKLALCGATALGALNDYAEEYGTINLEPRDSTYGLQIRTLVHAWGELKLVNHPLMSEHSEWTKAMFVVDTKNVMYRFLRGRDTRFLKERQGNGEDRVTHEFMTKAGLELRFPRTHGMAVGISEFIA